MTADFADRVVGGQKVCFSRAENFKFCSANFWNNFYGTIQNL